MNQHAGSSLTITSLVIQTVLAAVAIWYSWETRKLRQSSETQISLLQKQAKLALKPFLFPTLFDRNFFIQKIKEDTDIDDQQKQDTIREFEKTDFLFSCEISNETNRVASEILYYVYDKQNRNFVRSSQEIAVIGNQRSLSCTASAPFFSLDEVLEQIYQRYGTIFGLDISAYTKKQESFVLVLFKDVEGTSHFTRRNFIIDNSTLSHVSVSFSG